MWFYEQKKKWKRRLLLHVVVRNSQDQKISGKNITLLIISSRVRRLSIQNHAFYVVFQVFLTIPIFSDKFLSSTFLLQALRNILTRTMYRMKKVALYLVPTYCSKVHLKGSKIFCWVHMYLCMFFFSFASKRCPHVLIINLHTKLVYWP